jgi:hypothetical protein
VSFGCKVVQFKVRYSGSCPAFRLSACKISAFQSYNFRLWKNEVCLEESTPFVQGVVWFAWNSLLCAMAIDAHGTNMRQVKHRSDGAIKDLPLTFHWPKFILWLLVLGNPPTFLSSAIQHVLTSLQSS